MKSFEMNFGYEGDDYLSDGFKEARESKSEILDIRDFKEYRWGTSYKAILRGYTDVDCNIQDAPSKVRFYKLEKIISATAVPTGTCFPDSIPTTGRPNQVALFTTWKRTFANLDLQISGSDLEVIRSEIGKSGIDYRLCFLNHKKQTLRIDKVSIRP